MKENIRGFTSTLLALNMASCVVVVVVVFFNEANKWSFRRLSKSFEEINIPFRCIKTKIMRECVCVSLEKGVYFFFVVT
jgi:hypothetical protein